MTLEQERAAVIARLENHGYLDPACKGCQESYAHYRTKWEPGGLGPFVPSHKPSPLCESGKRPHCTCDMCW